MVRIYAALYYEDREDKERIYRNRKDAFCLDDDSFIDTFRVSKKIVQDLCNALRTDLFKISNVRTVLSVETQVLCALSFFANGSYQKTIGRDMYVGLSQSSVNRAVKRVTESMNKRLLHREVSFPSLEEYQQLKVDFHDYCGLPGVIGAIDCTHISIIAPPQPLEECYLNRKSYHSINVQLVCDQNMKILNINAKYPGRTHDAFICRYSELRGILQGDHRTNAQNCWLLGDSGYPLEPWLMTPILTPLNASERRYNRAHVRGRNVIERCNGVFKCRFRCLRRHRTMNVSPTMASNITNSCAILHNMCIRYKEDDDEFSDDDDSDDDDDDEIPHSRNATALNLRKLIIQNHFL